MVLLLHTYSRNNHGDGLLVDLSLKLIKKRFPEESVQILSSDAKSFKDLSNVTQLPGMDKENKILKIIYALSNIIRASISLVFRYSNFFNEGKNSKIVYCVGGGYLRGKTLKELFATLAVHFPQLIWISINYKKSFYLPQSIGPFPQLVKRIINKEFKNIDSVFVRDDQSFTFFSDKTNIFRVPDLAVCEIGEKLEKNSLASNSQKIYIIARDINFPAEEKNLYYEKIKKLKLLLPNSELVIQSKGRGNNDANFYNNIFNQNRYRSFSEITKSGEGGIVISVRLHGALEAILSGFPAIHISYERKGYGAYHDLNLLEYYHSVTKFEPNTILNQVKSIQSNPKIFWDNIFSSKTRIQSKYQFMLNNIKNITY